jgi:RNA polymerase sigma factor (sigma-70 family)
MASPTSTILRHLSGLLRPAATTATDCRLLDRFAAGRDPEAFAELVRRHGGLVLDVCRRILGHEQDAEDAFQATFLVLARSAGSVRKRESLASFLYGVARRTALRLRTELARRRRHERGVEAAEAEPPPDLTWHEVRRALDEELARLPEKYRAPLVLCYLEGRTQREAASDLGWKEGILRGRLDRGRERLRARLIRRGVAPSAILATAALAPRGEAALVPAALAEAAARAAVSPMPTAAPAGLLARAVMRGMLLSRLKIIALLVLTVGLTAVGVGLLRPPVSANNGAQTAAAAPPSSPVQDRYGDPLPPGALARLGTTRFRHDSWLTAFALSPDGRTLAAASGRSIHLWDAATGRERLRLEGHEESVRCLAWSSDGATFVSGGDDNTVRLWDPATGKEERRLEGHGGEARRGQGGVHAVAFAANGSRVISAGGDNTLRIWDTATGKQVLRPELLVKVVRSLAVSSDGRTLAVALGYSDKPNTVWLAEGATGRAIRRLPQEFEVSQVAFSPDGKSLAVAGSVPGRPGELRLWDVATGKEVRRFKGHADAALWAAFTPDGKTLASAGYDRTVRVWQTDTGKELRRFEGPTPWYRVAFTPDGKTLLAYGAENTLHFWDLTTGKEALSFDGHHRGVDGVVFSPDGRQLITRGQEEVRVWDTARRAEVGRFGFAPRDFPTTAFFKADGTALTAGTADGQLRLYEIASGKELRALRPDGWMTCQASPDGKVLAVHDTKDHSLILWELTTGKERVRTAPPPENVSDMAFAPDGAVLAVSSGTDLFIHLFDTATGKELPALGPHKGGMTTLTFSADGKTVAGSCMGDTLQLWEVAIGRQRLQIDHGGPVVTAMAFSPNGRLLATGYNGLYFKGGPNGRTVPISPEERDKIRLWDLSTGRELHRFAGHRGGVTGLAFLPDGRMLASSSHDTTVLFWDVATVLQAKLPRAAAPSAHQLDSLWKDLGGNDAAQAYRAVHALAAAPEQAVLWIKERVRPVPLADAHKLERLIADLDREDFATRETAARELARLGEAARPALRKALQGRPSAEVRRQVSRLLEELDGGARLAEVRSVEVLEQAGTTAARQVLEELAKGEPEARITREAREALNRQQRKAAGP